MTEALAKVNNFQLPGLPTNQQRQATEAACSPFLPSLKLVQGISREIEQGFTAGEFLIQGETTKLGSKLEIGVYGRRDHALILKDTSKVEESFLWDSPVFKKIKASKADRSQGISVFWGIGDFLVWLPKHGRFVTFFLGRTSQRFLSLELIDYLTPMENRKSELAKEKPNTNIFELYSHFETKKFGPKNRCYVPMVTPLPVDKADYAAPTQGDFESAFEIFQAPVKMEAECEYEEASSKDVR
jgi:hypothetical protein